MSWRRVPAFLPSLTLKLLPLSEAQRAAFETTGFVKELVFRTVPQATKVRFVLARNMQLRVPSLQSN